jgi:hypothetical protein
MISSVLLIFPPNPCLPFGHILQLELLKQLAHGLFVRSWGVLSVLLLDFRDHLIDDGLGHGIAFEGRNGT